MRSCELRYPSGSAGGVSFCAEARGGDISLSGATRFCQQRHRCSPSGRRIQNYVGCKALPLYGAREESFRAVRRSGSGDRSAGDPVRNLFAPQLQSDEREIQKPTVFGGVLFHISFAVERNMAAGGIHAGRGCSPQSENRKRAVGDAGPYGWIDESAPVFEGAPMRAVGDAGSYGVRDRRHDEIRVGGVCPLGRSNAGRGSGWRFPAGCDR